MTIPMSLRGTKCRSNLGGGGGLPRYARNDNVMTSALLVYLYWLKRVIDASFGTDTMALRRDTHEKNRQFLACSSANCRNGGL